MAQFLQKSIMTGKLVIDGGESILLFRCSIMPLQSCLLTTLWHIFFEFSKKWNRFSATNFIYLSQISYQFLLIPIKHCVGSIFCKYFLIKYDRQAEIQFNNSLYCLTCRATISTLSSIEKDHCYISSFSSEEKSASTNDLSDLLPVGAQEELEAEFEQLFDDWDSLPCDSDDDDGDFLRSLISSPLGTNDSTSIHGSEGYGTDTSDTGDTLNASPAIQTETLSKPLEIIKEVSPKQLEENIKPPTPVFQAHSLIRCQPTKSAAPKSSPVIFLNKNRVTKKPAAVTRVYHIPKIDSTSQGNTKVETQKRKTVLLRVIRPTKR